jgi:hypothetical protein
MLMQINLIKLFINKYQLLIAYFISSSLFYIVIYLYNVDILNWGDNAAYLSIAKCINQYIFLNDCNYSLENKYSIGYPVVLSFLSYFIDDDVLLLVFPNLFFGLINICLIEILFGRNVAFYFIFINLNLISRNILGGAEPLYILTTLICFISSKNIFILSTFGLFSFSLRVIGIINIISIGVFLFFIKKNYIKYFIYNVIFIFFIIYISSIIQNTELSLTFAAYDRDRYTNSYFTYPFLSFYLEIENTYRLLSHIKFLFYFILFISSFYFIYFNFRNRNIYIYDIYYLLYAVFLITYNSSWAYIEFVRFYAPIMPISLYYLGKFLPENIFFKYLFLIIFTLVSALSVSKFFI